jgi:hypothetical protein
MCALLGCKVYILGLLFISTRGKNPKLHVVSLQSNGSYSSCAMIATGRGKMAGNFDLPGPAAPFMCTSCSGMDESMTAGPLSVDSSTAASKLALGHSCHYAASPQSYGRARGGGWQEELSPVQCGEIPGEAGRSACGQGCGRQEEGSPAQARRHSRQSDKRGRRGAAGRGSARGRGADRGDGAAAE